MTSLLLWFAGSAAVPRWYVCLASAALVIVATVFLAGLYLWIEGKIFDANESGPR